MRALICARDVGRRLARRSPLTCLQLLFGLHLDFYWQHLLDAADCCARRQIFGAKRNAAGRRRRRGDDELAGAAAEKIDGIVELRAAGAARCSGHERDGAERRAAGSCGDGQRVDEVRGRIRDVRGAAAAVAASDAACMLV